MSGNRTNLLKDRRIRAALVAAAALALIAGGLAVVYGVSPTVRLEVDRIASLLGEADITPVREYLLAWGVWAPLLSAVLQVVTSVIPPLPSWVLPIVNAMVFGAVPGGLLSFATALVAAAICFGLARALGRPWVERIVPEGSLERWDSFFDRRGVLAVAVGRVIPFINPDILSYAAGLTRMGWRRFLLGIGVGSVPSIVLYSWAGEQGAEEVGWLLVPAVVTSVLAVAAYVLYRRWGRTGDQEAEEETDEEAAAVGKAEPESEVDQGAGSYDGERPTEDRTATHEIPSLGNRGSPRENPS